MSDVTGEKPVRKFPPPCWSKDEALALIEAYRERWYALRRGYLRTADWDAVSESVDRAYPEASPAKTSAQCRHKMEKLRQRYRVEKQLAASVPGRFLSSWFFFDAMDAMDGSSNPTLESRALAKVDGDSGPNIDLGPEGLTSGSGIRFNPSSDRNSVLKKPTKSVANSNTIFGGRVSKDCSWYLDFDSDNEEDGDGGFKAGFLVGGQIDENLIPQGYRAKENRRVYRNSWQGLTQRFRADHDLSGFRVNTPIYEDPGRPRKFIKVDKKMNPNFWEGMNVSKIDKDGDIWVKLPRGKDSGKIDRTWNSDAGVANGFSPAGKKGCGGTKRGNNAVDEMVSSIKVLGDELMKIERMKMEMAMEVEKMRMESETKRNQLILESQKQIVDDFVKGLLHLKQQPPPPHPSSAGTTGF